MKKNALQQIKAIINATVNYDELGSNSEQIAGLFRTYLRAATEKINKPTLFSDFSAELHTINQPNLFEYTQDFLTEPEPVISVSPIQLSAEWHPTPPTTAAVTKLLPTKTALLKLFKQDQLAESSIIASSAAIVCTTAPVAYATLDPYRQGWAAVDLAMRELVAVGVNPDQIALGVNFCWQAEIGEIEQLGQLVRCLQGLHDVAMAYRIPFITCQVRLLTNVAPNTLQINAIGHKPLPDNTITATPKHSENQLFLIGETRNEMGGSRYARLHGEDGGIVPPPLTEGLLRYRALYRAINDDLVESCRILSHGGLGIALVQMLQASSLGAEITLKKVISNIAHDDILLFSESIGRILIEVKPENLQKLAFQLLVEPNAQIGTICANNRLIVAGYLGECMLDIGVEEI